MDWLPRRLLAALAAFLLGGFVGALAAVPWGLAALGAGIGSALGVGAVMVADAWRAFHLLRWLRGDQEQAAPRDAGLWGELAYRIERALRLRERQLRAERGRLTEFLSAIDASPNGVLLLDAEAQIAWTNTMAADHLGLDPRRDRGQPLTNLVRAPAFVDHLQAGVFDEPVSFTLPGRGRTLSALLRPYGDGQLLVLTQDVTERLRADAMRRDFVANVSHEIRTPLTVLAGFVETMASLPLTEVERRRVLTLMQQQTERMQDLVADLLTLAQIEGGPRPPTDRWVPVEPLLQRAAADGRSLSGGRHTLTVGESGAAMLAGTETELASALGNLVNNAVRYTPDGGRIDVQWFVRADGSGGFEVTDSGVGIAREHLPRLTERFYRVDSSRSRETGGTGLGLSIVKHAIQRHGGELEIESEPGRGSRFRLWFPAARVRLAEAAVSASAVLPG